MSRAARDEEVSDAVAPIEEVRVLNHVLADSARVAACEQRSERRVDLEVGIEVHAAELVEHEVPDHLRLLLHVRVRRELLVKLDGLRTLLEVLVDLRSRTSDERDAQFLRDYSCCFHMQ